MTILGRTNMRGGIGREFFVRRFPVLIFAWIAPAICLAQDTPDYFRQNCMNCHTIGGGRRSGPDLKNVTERKDAEWLIAFMQDPPEVVESGDPYAKKLVEESRGQVMPVVGGMDRYRAEQILKLIEEESQKEKSQFQGVKISNAPFTAADRELGRGIFLGQVRLENGGTACIHCHSMHDLSALGGGQLGPDLTRVYERLEGRNALGPWLMAPATETMQPIFKSHPLEAGEIHALLAYFESSAKQEPADTAANRAAFLLMGLLLAAGIIFGFDAIWKGRFYGVRAPLVKESKARIQHTGVGTETVSANLTSPHGT